MHYVYILHYDFPNRPPLHYKGKTDDLIRRLAQHQKGEGSVTTHRYNKIGGQFTLARLYEFDSSKSQSKFERYIKKIPSREVCQICRARAASKGREA